MAMTLRLPDDLDAKLTELAARERMSKQQLVRRTIERYVDDASHTDRVRQLAERAAADFPETLRRLGE